MVYVLMGKYKTHAQTSYTHPFTHTHTHTQNQAQKAQGSLLLTLALGAYTVLALGAATTEGANALWLNLTGAVTVVGALSVYGGKGKAQAARV